MAKNKKFKILIMAAGTGGHIIPGLAIAKKLQEDNQSVEIQWLGTHKGLESKLVSKENIKINYISVWGLRNKAILIKLLAPFRLLYALLHAIIVMLKFRPNIVLGMGGFVCGPGGLAAFLTRRKLVIHEQNAIAGFTNSILARFAKQVFEGFPNSFNKIQSKIKHKLKYTGNPIRTDILNIPSPKIRFQNKLNKKDVNILIIGGSRGAVALNKLIPETLNQLLNKNNTDVNYNITHQCGDLNYKETLSVYKKYNLDNKNNINIIKYIDNIVDYYSNADLIICRSGAMTVSEIAAVGLAAIFIPFPQAVDDHQTKNAKFLESNNAAVIMQQKNLTSENLADKILELINTEDLLERMAINAKKVSKVEALGNICNKIFQPKS